MLKIKSILIFFLFSVFAITVPKTTTSITTSTKEVTTTFTAPTEPPITTVPSRTVTTTQATTTSANTVSIVSTTTAAASSLPSTILVVPPTTATVRSDTSTVETTVTKTAATSGYTSSPTALPMKMPSGEMKTVKKVAFRIAAYFENTVGNNTTEFSEVIKKQLIEQLNFPKGVIQDIYLTKGSILVTLVLQNTKKQSVEDSVGELAQALGEGHLKLHGLDNKPLEVPRQPLQVLKDPTDHKSGLSAVFLGSASVGICIVLIMYLVLISFMTKHSRKQEALRIAQRIAAQSVPKYLPLPLPHTLDGPAHKPNLHGLNTGEDLDSGIFDSDEAKRKAAQLNK